MRLNQTLSIALLATLLAACGGSLDGSGDGGTTTPTPEPTGEPSPTPTPDVPPPAEPGVPASFVYLSATPNWIAVKGTGGAGRQESSIVGFKLIDRNGDAVEDVDVTFSVTAPNGTNIDPLTGTTNAEGVVSTTVLSGTVSGPVRVSVITEDGSGITMISDSLSVSTGLPDQNSFSMSFETHAPEGLNIEGATSGVTIRLADKYNNAVPNGTTVHFTTEGGAIRDADTGTVGSCLTDGSSCSLEWVSQNPRVRGNILSNYADIGQCAYWGFGPELFGPCINDGGMGRPYGGRSTVTAYTLGEELFVDNDADGWYTEGDDFFVKDDLPEVFYDHNEDGYYKEDQNAINVNDDYEEYADLSPQDNVYSAGNGIYNGLLCSDDSELLGTCSKEPIYVRQSSVMIMAASKPYIRIQNASGADTGLVDLTGSNVEQDLTVYLAGIYNNTPPTGTTISLVTDNGDFSGPTDFTVNRTTSSIGGLGPFSFDFTMTQEETPNKKTTGKLSIIITTPGANSIASTVTTYTMTVIDNAAPEATPTPTP